MRIHVSAFVLMCSIFMYSIFLQPSYAFGDSTPVIVEKEINPGEDWYTCKKPSEYKCGKSSDGGNCSFEINKDKILVYEDDILKPKGLGFKSTLKWCQKDYGLDGFHHLDWHVGMRLHGKAFADRYGFWRHAKDTERKSNRNWEVTTDWSDPFSVDGLPAYIKPKNSEGELLHFNIYSFQYNKAWGEVVRRAAGHKQFARTVIKRNKECGLPSKKPCLVCSDWSSYDPEAHITCIGRQDFCFDNLDVEKKEQYSPKYCRNSDLYNNLQHEVDKACNYEWPGLDVWKKERFSTVIDAKKSYKLPKDGLYVFVYRRDNSFVLRKSDRPSKEHKGDHGWCFIGNKDCIWVDEKGKPKNPEKPCGWEKNPIFVRHSQIASDGGPKNKKVLYAGTLEIYNGKALWMSARSGHYLPKRTGMENTIKAFKFFTNIDYDIEYRDFDDPDTCIKLPCHEKDIKKCKYKCKGVPSQCVNLDFDHKQPNVCKK